MCYDATNPFFGLQVAALKNDIVVVQGLDDPKDNNLYSLTSSSSNKAGA